MHEIVMEPLLNARSANPDGLSVTYDLTKRIGQLSNKELGIALSEVFFENDANKWFTVDGKTVHFRADYKVRILFPALNSKEAGTIMSYFYYNLEKVIIPMQFAEQLRGSFGTMFGLAGKTRESIYAAELKNNIMDNINVEYI